MARDLLIGLGDGEEWWITLDSGVALNLCIQIGRNWREMELGEDCDPSAILQSRCNGSTDGPPCRPCSIYGGPSVHRLLLDFLIALRLLWDSVLR